MTSDFYADPESDTGVEVWTTGSNVAWTFVTAATLADALAHLAKVVEQSGVDRYVTDLHFEVGEHDVTVGALVEDGDR